MFYPNNSPLLAGAYSLPPLPSKHTARVFAIGLTLLLLLWGHAFGQGGTTMSDILPSSTGQNLGNTGQRWNLYGFNLDVTGFVTFSGSGSTGNLTPGSAVINGVLAQVPTSPFSSRQTFNGGITGSGDTGSLTLGSGALASSPAWTGAHSFAKAVSIASPGIYTNLANNFQSTMLDGLTKANINSLQAGIFLTDVLDIGQLTPVGATVQQASGLGVFTQVNSAATNQVSIYSQCAAGVNAAKCWGYNPSVADYDVNGTAYTSVTLHGIEIDLNAKNSSTAGDAIFIQGNLAGNTLGNIGAIHIPKPAAGSWGYGLQIDDQSLLSSNSQALFIGASGTVSAPSYQIILRGRNSSGVSSPARIFADQNGAQTNSGVMTTNGAYSSGASAGDFVAYNGASVKSDTAAHNAAYQLIGGNSSNQVAIDSGAQGTVIGGTVKIAGGATIANSNAVPQVGTPTVNQAACIKAAGPPVVIGYCSTVVSAGGGCTCN